MKREGTHTKFFLKKLRMTARAYSTPIEARPCTSTTPNNKKIKIKTKKKL